MIVKRLVDLAQFSPEKMGKVDIALGETLFAGLNCFEPGQQHAAHAHAGQDKLYVVLEGEAEIHVGDERAMVSAPERLLSHLRGVVHSIRNTGAGRLIVMAVLAPRPGK